MHLPDGFLDLKTTALAAGAAVGGVAYAVRQARALRPKQVPMLGLAAAFVFAAQMLNFPVAGGTSGHVIGGVMAAVLLGPAAGVIVMTSVLIVQCLMFADGGLLALGANVFNMAIASTCGGYLAYRAVRFLAPMRGPRGIVFAASFAGWCGTVLGAISCAGQLALSNTAPWEVVFPAMANIHMIIGLGEGLVTGLIVAAVLRARPELVVAENPEDTAVNGVAGYVATLALGFIVFVAPFASPWPDGLEHVAAKLGFEHQAQSSALRGAFPDYQVPFVGSPALATVIAGVAGAVMAFLAAWLLSKYLVPGLSVRKDGPHGN